MKFAPILDGRKFKAESEGAKVHNEIEVAGNMRNLQLSQQSLALSKNADSIVHRET